MSTSTRQVKVNIDRDSMTNAEVAKAQEGLSKLPQHVSTRLNERGVEVHISTRADMTPAWDEYSRQYAIDTNTTIADGREFGDLSWYDPSTNEIFISAGSSTGSANVYTHELGHAVDYQWTGNVAISRTNEFKALHQQYILNNPLIPSYYRGGPSGNSPQAGQAETFAEGYARYLQNGKLALTGFLGSREAAVKLIAIWTKYGIVR